jgi:hypothetical protein
MKNNSTIHSDFWMDDFDFEEFENQDDTARLIRMNMTRRAISNFVNILTGKSIPVIYNDAGANMTDGKTVYLSADIDNPEDFDTMVGLALHEGSHVALTDFRVVTDIWQNVPRELYDIAGPKGFSKMEVVEFLKNVHNVVEDRFIDNYVYQTAPGYRGYYLALYEKYFYSKHVDSMLKSELYRSKTIQSYDARLINIANRNTDLDALPGFRDIANVLDLKNIGRLTTTKDRFDVAIEVCKIVYANVDTQDQQKEENAASDQSGSNVIVIVDGGSDSGSDSGSDVSGSNASNVFGGIESTCSNSSAAQSNEETTKKKNEQSGISQSKRNLIEKALNKQKVFILGQIKKRKVTDREAKILGDLEKAGVTIVNVGTKMDDSSPITSGVECVVVKSLTKELLMSDQFPCSCFDLAGNPDPDTLAAVNRGIQLGNLLGKRLSVRSEVNVTKYMRKSMGKIDRRVLSELGIDNENVFYRNEVDQYKNAYLHLSIDASSSMVGDKWRKTITAATAICKAASMINNLKVSVSIRATSRGNSLPYIAMVYDSTKDSFAKVRNMFPYLVANGSTPEGLCFEAIMDMLRDKEENEDCYFVNFSDGEPCYSYHKNNTYINYSYQNGANHTRKQVNEIRKKGYTVLSYYIGNRNENAQSQPHFKMMYGQDARYIDVTNIVSVAKTLNDMFLSSTSKI